MFGQVTIALVVVLVGYGYKAIKPPPPKICGSPGGPPVTSSRIKLKDGRYLAYREGGVSKQEAKYKVIVIHGLDCSKDLDIPVSRELVEELKIYFLFYDRAGYGESDADPKHSLKSEAYDIQQLADALHLGSKFYLLALSIGTCPAWSCIKYIPERLAGVSLVGSFFNYWWPCFPSDFSKAALRKQLVRDQWAIRVAHYAPWLFYWWMTQKWFPSMSIMCEDSFAIFSRRDLEISQIIVSKLLAVGRDKVKQQGLYESICRDLMIGHGKWEFDPSDLSNPDSSVHMWQGSEDKIAPVEVNRFISEKVKWINYHEVRGSGHLLIFDHIICESILTTLLLG